jgi:hypothetical protein
MRWWPTEGREECLQGLFPSYGNAIDGQHRVWGNVSGLVGVWEVGQPAHVLPEAGAINASVRDSNEVMAVGTAVNAGAPFPQNNAQAAAHYRFPSTITRLPFPGPVTYQTTCAALGINTALVTVGGCDGRAMLWPDTSTVLDLNAQAPAAFVLAYALGINDDGEIIGTSAGRNWLLTPIPPHVAQCGGSVPCQCGDVIADYTFTTHLGPCAVQGTDAALIVPSGVRVNGNGFRVIGTGDGTGVLFDGTQNSQVGVLHVTGFDVSVLMRGGATGNYYHNSWVWNNREGIVVDSGAYANWIWAIASLINHETGIHLADVSGNILGYNVAWSNPISLRTDRARGNTIWVNGLFGDAGHAMTMTDSHGHALVWNYFAGGDIVLRDSEDNWWHGNTVECPVIREQAVASSR